MIPPLNTTHHCRFSHNRQVVQCQVHQALGGQRAAESGKRTARRGGHGRGDRRERSHYPTKGVLEDCRKEELWYPVYCVSVCSQNELCTGHYRQVDWTRATAVEVAV